MKQIYIFMLLVFLSSESSAEIKVSDFFSKDELDYAASGNLITSVRLKYNDMIISDGKFKNHAAAVNAEYSEPWFNSGEMLAIEKGFIPYKNDTASKLRFYNALISFSSLSGMKYYSHKARSVEPFILKSYGIMSSDNKSEIKDPVSDKIEDKRTGYFMMTDNKFGELVFKSGLYSEKNNFILKNVSVNPIKKFGVKINNSGEYITVSYFIYDDKLRGYFFYTVSALRIRSDFFLKINAVSPKGFGNRLRAGTVHLVKNIGFDWNYKIMAFE